MRNTTALLAPLLLALALPAIAAMLVDAPPPPPIPDGPLEEDGSQQKNAASGTMSLGQALYESNCTNCHESVTRVSFRRTMRSLQELREQVGCRKAAMERGRGRGSCTLPRQRALPVLVVSSEKVQAINGGRDTCPGHRDTYPGHRDLCPGHRDPSPCRIGLCASHLGHHTGHRDICT